ncbi:MAG: hypothetical protein BIFFINMI_00295 [Phycisphaerae bacterium]|nr:hypothetical protein [Phycisphaerae bacterium]
MLLTHEPGDSLGRATRRGRSVTGLRLLLAGMGGLLLAVAGGCGPASVTEVRDVAELQELIDATHKPLLVDYYKQGCEHCNAFETTLRGLNAEYGGRIAAAKFLLMKADGVCAAPEFAEKHEILLYPTVILYVDGKERKRFVQDYLWTDYNAAIDEVLGAPTTQPEAGH